MVGHTVETIYFGGGTPSLLSKSELQQLLETIYVNFNVSNTPEITLEANPDDLQLKQIRDISNTEINRLSIGIQSFFDEDLKAMNRAHSAKEAIKSLEEASNHFSNITIDLIYGIPNMQLEKWHQNLEIAFEFDVPHISSYALTVEPKTALESFIKKGTYPEMDEELSLQHFNHLITQTSEKGLVQYEISNFGKPNFFSKHNTSYWQGKPFVGIGPSAHSFNGNRRSWNVANNAKYIKAITQGKLPQEYEVLSTKDQYNEYVMTGLRTIWGVELTHLENKFGESYRDHFINSSKNFMANGMLYYANAQMKAIVATNKGKFLVDGIAADLFLI